MSEIGELIDGRYRLERVLGSGGMGVVYLAVDTDGGPPVAVKMLRSAVIESGDARARLGREIQLLSLLNSPHVAQLYTAGYLDDGSPYFVMEYLEGRDLKAELLRRGPLPLAEAAAYLVQACRGIAVAHRHDIVHRDLKPHNMILTNLDAARKLKIVDFGVAKLLNSADPNLTRTDSVVGTPLYMCPEQLFDSKMVTTQADVWALGVILYELLTGFPPFHDESAGAVIAAVTLDDPVPIRKIRPDLPDAVWLLIDSALKKIPAERLETVEEFEARLLPYALPVERLVVSASAYDETKWSYDRPPRSRSQSILRRQIQEAVDRGANADRDTVRYLRTGPTHNSSASAERLSLIPSIKHVSGPPGQRSSEPVVSASKTLPNDSIFREVASSKRRWIVAGVSAVLLASVGLLFWPVRRANVDVTQPPVAIDSGFPPATASRGAPLAVRESAIPSSTAMVPPPEDPGNAPTHARAIPSPVPTSASVRRSVAAKPKRPTRTPNRATVTTAHPAAPAVPLHL